MLPKQLKVGLTLFALILAVAFLGGNWETSAAQTVPDAPVLVPVIIPLIPVTGGCDGPVVQAVGGCCVPVDAVKKGLNSKAEVEKSTVGLDVYKIYGDVLNCFVEEGNHEIKNYKFLKPASVYFDLSAYSLDAFKKDGLISIFWFNVKTRSWEKVPTTLESGTARLVAPAVFSGQYVVGVPEK